MISNERPPGLGYHAMVYDAESKRIILFGGQMGDTAGHPEVFTSSETWAYDPARNLWRKMEPKLSPPAMAAHAMAYDNESDRMILYGGGGIYDQEKLEDYVLDQTWAYDFNSNT
jgi:N-acetylneuraminic acid mutarotase